MDSKTGIATAAVVGASSLYFAKKFFRGGVCKLNRDLTGQVAIITGSNTGIGKETARELCRQGANVVLACRSEEKANAVIDEFKKENPKIKVEFIKLDLSDLESIRSFVTEFNKRHSRLDILINNAATVTWDRKETKDGFELQFGTNHVGPFYLTTLLLDLLKSSGDSRIINVSSEGHHVANIDWDDLMSEKKKYASFMTYVRSKLANNMFTRDLAKKLEGTNVRVVCLHPGSVITDISRDVKERWYSQLLWKIFAANPVAGFFWKTPAQGAQTTIYCALEEHEKLRHGAYYKDCKVAKESSKVDKEEDRKRLWEITEKLIAEKTQKNSK